MHGGTSEAIPSIPKQLGIYFRRTAIPIRIPTPKATESVTSGRCLVSVAIRCRASLPSLAPLLTVWSLKLAASRCRRNFSYCPPIVGDGSCRTASLWRNMSSNEDAVFRIPSAPNSDLDGTVPASVCLLGPTQRQQALILSAHLMLAVRAATRGHHHRVMQKAEHSVGVNNRIAELRAP